MEIRRENSVDIRDRELGAGGAEGRRKASGGGRRPKLPARSEADGLKRCAGAARRTRPSFWPVSLRAGESGEPCVKDWSRLRRARRV